MTAEVPSLLLAFTAGLLSFASPCVLPLIPSYISYVGGVSIDELHRGEQARGPMMLKTSLFVLGFSLVFIVLGILFSGSGLLLAGLGPLINLLAGGVVILLGINVLFDLWKFLLVERRVHAPAGPRGYVGSMLVGMAFGAGWTPCIGPILAGILFLAGQSSRIAQGALLLSVYSLGLGLPFLAAGFFFPRMVGALQRIRRHLPAIKIGSGLFLIGVGVLIALGRFQQLNATLVAAGLNLRRWNAARPEIARLGFSLAAAAMALLILLPWLVRSARGASAGRSGHSRGPHAITVAIAGGLLLLGMLQAFDVVNLPTILSSWLTYQGA